MESTIGLATLPPTKKHKTLADANAKCVCVRAIQKALFAQESLISSNFVYLKQGVRLANNAINVVYKNQ